MTSVPALTVEIRLRLRSGFRRPIRSLESDAFDAVFSQRIAEADLFHGFSNEPGAQPTQPMLVAREA